MAKKHGRRGMVYMGIASAAATAEPVANIKKWALSRKTDMSEATSFEDENKVYLGGLPDGGGSMEGFWDDATEQTYTAASDGEARKTYLYFDRTASKYMFGLFIWDWEVEVPNDGPISLKGAFMPAGKVSKV